FAKLGIERPIVLGHSWGAMVAVALGLRYPQDVGSLVLVSGYHYPTARADVALMSLPAIPVIGDLMTHTISPLLGRLIWRGLLWKLFSPNQVTAAFERFPKWMALRPGQIHASAAESAMMIPAAARLSRRYRELTVPAVIMAGAGDRQVTPAHHASRLHRELADSTLHIVPGVGHMVHHIVPEVVLAAIHEAADAAMRRVGASAAFAPAPAPDQATSFSPIKPATISPMQASRSAVAGSPKRTMPRIAVPTVPMPVHTA
ncbi:MAG: alpha/beta hydrolase, partial [Rhizobiales bacterium]|nr:alpha/beta hydrolase [Hyphomicrobiales bacterium]